MGNNRKQQQQALEPKKKRKKKGRPSLLELQKRSLRLQKQQQIQSNPNPIPNSHKNPYLKFPNRRSTRRNPNPSPNLDDADEEDDDNDEAEDEEEEEEEESNAKRKEKELKQVMRIPNGSDLAEPGSDSDGGSRKKRKIYAVEETARQNSSAKATEEAQGDPTDSGPTTPLPDKKLLVFILDRLQKKDTYGVYAEPVDPEELPDYHEIIENPMDFGTVRKKLDSGAYENLEQFESDVFLICSNAMRYNAPDTVYFRQARSIQELAQKDFGNLRQASDDDEQEPKTVRRGRPPIKNVMKRIGRTQSDPTGSDFSPDVTLANARDGTHNSNLARDLVKKGPSFEKPSMTNSYRLTNQHRTERNEEHSGTPLKGVSMRNWKKNSAMDESRRNTYNQPLQSIGVWESSVLTTFDWEGKLLMPVGVYMEHAYARSLARFAANLGPIGWEIAAKRIERVLPPGTKFGPGWIGENDTAKQFHPPLLSPSLHISSQAKLSHTAASSGDKKMTESCELASNNSNLPLSASASPATAMCKPIDSIKQEGELGLLDGGVCAKIPLELSHNSAMQHPKNGVGLLDGGVCAKIPLELSHNSAMQHPKNGFNPGYGLNLPLQALKMNHQTSLPELAMTHSHALDMVSRSYRNNNVGNNQAPITQSIAEEDARPATGNLNAVESGSSLREPDYSSEGQQQSGSLPKPGTDPPDLNVDFRSPGSPVSGMMIDAKQQQQPLPDLALQL